MVLEGRSLCWLCVRVGGRQRDADDPVFLQRCAWHHVSLSLVHYALYLIHGTQIASHARDCGLTKWSL